LYSSSELRMMFNILIQERLGITSAEIILSKDILLSESDLLYVRSVVKRLLSNEPFQYVIGKVEFFGLEFKIDKRALIPRPETEELVQWILEDFKDKTELKILDLCTGSGCIAIALKNNLIDADVSGLELSIDALDLCHQNADQLKTTISWIHSDVLQSASYSHFQQASFDVWVSNPPYVLNSDKNEMHRNVLDHEPHMALFVEDNDPLVFYREIASQAKKYLKSSGRLYFEIHENLGQMMISLLENLGFTEIEIKQDLQGRNRMVKAVKP